MHTAGAGVLLNADSWVCRLYPDDREAAARDHRKQLVEELQWAMAEQLLRQGVSVILDWGLWVRSERDHYRQLATAAGAQTTVVFLDAPLETLQARVADRNRNLPPGTFHISVDELNEWATIFEPPAEDELSGG